MFDGRQAEALQQERLANLPQARVGGHLVEGGAERGQLARAGDQGQAGGADGPGQDPRPRRQTGSPAVQMATASALAT